MQVLGPYQLQEVLGRGGMGLVYRAVDTLSGREVAVKVLSPSFSTAEGFRDRFEAEIHSLERLRHAHIVELYGFGEEAGTLFYAMELVTGGSLQEELLAGRHYSWRDVIALAVDICAALKHAHDHGVIHRDIKPANLLLDGEGRVKLTDFGIAKLFGEAHRTMAGSIVGTADYMAPEQAAGLPATARCDLYSLGCVMYAMLSGRPPFRGKTALEVLHKVRYEVPLPVRHHSLETPMELDQVISQLLAKEPAERIPTALALSKRLQAIEHGLTVVGDAENGDASDTGSARDVLPIERSLMDSETVEAELPSPAAPASAEGMDTIDGEPAPKTQTMPGPPSPARPTRFTLVDEEYRQKKELESAEPTWMVAGRILVLAAALIALGLGYWWIAQPRTADQLFAQIRRLRDEANAESGLATTPRWREFLRRFPDDPRAEQVRQWQSEAELSRKLRQLLIRTKRAEPATLVIEDLLRDALRLQATHPDQALAQLQAMLTLYRDTESLSSQEREYLQLAEFQCDQLQLQLDASADLHRKRLRQWLRQLQGLEGDAQMELARSILATYATKTWATHELESVRRLLEGSETRE